MKRLIALVVLLSGVSSAIAQSFYGYAAMDVPTTQGQQFTVLRARIGMFQQMQQSKVAFEYDAASQVMTYANLTLSYDFGWSNLDVVAGKYLAPVAYLYDSQKLLHATRYASTLNGFSVYGTGAMVKVSTGKWLSRLAYYGQEQMAATIGYGPVAVFWEKDAGQGLMFNYMKIYADRHFRFCAGLANRSSLANSTALLEIELFPNVYWWNQVDYEGRVHCLNGFTWQYAKQSFAKLYYDSMAKMAKIQLTFTM
ncbi:MAG: hypothetical protein ACKKL5_01575 [Candidatus Komeilibacteria bacterium]